MTFFCSTSSCPSASTRTATPSPGRRARRPARCPTTRGRASGTRASAAPDPRPDRGTVGRDHEHGRLGTLSLLASIDLPAGEATPLAGETHKSSDYVEFLKILDGKYPKGDLIRIVLDNVSVHTSAETRHYLTTVPGRFEFVSAPRHGSRPDLSRASSRR